MWWWIVGVVVVVLIAFACWIAWELIHAPMVDDVLDDFTFVDDGEELVESEDA